MLSPNNKLQDRYRIIRHLGQGGMGTVYEAIDERVNCIVVVKEFLKGDPGAFKREAELLANLRHSSLPHVTDHFSVDEGSFLVMDFISGNDLAELLELRGSPFPVNQVLGWADELLKVLEYLHGQGVLHRDIKPPNLKLTRKGKLFLLDFGLAKGAVGQMSTLKTDRSVVGYTPGYASLEQIHEHGTDERSDLYSLSATLYHILTGVRPIDAPTRDLTVDEEKRDPLRPLHELNPQVSLALSAVIHQAMAIRRRERPETAAEMRRLLSMASRALDESHQREAKRGYQEAVRQAQDADAHHPEEEQQRSRQAAEEQARRQRDAEEEKQRAYEAEKVRRRSDAANVMPPVISPPIVAVPPTQNASLPMRVFDASAQTRTLQTPPPIFRPTYSQRASPINVTSGAIGRGANKSRWLLLAAAIALLSVVVFIVVKMIVQRQDEAPLTQLTVEEAQKIEDEKHRLLQAVGITQDNALITEVGKKLEIIDANGQPNSNFRPFLDEHLKWAEKNRAWVQEHRDPVKAREYVMAHK